ncbi:MAG: hypothetical protein CMD99_00140 [Gammaproteobacteria bacterium]|nr:hypothetical protein [Gammaproteobacteria bacterium]|tara:strand:+ start:135 stop:527 length:393 start_codon:yes stop_codon:yes gene_type:complete
MINENQLTELNGIGCDLSSELEDWLHNDAEGQNFGSCYVNGFMHCNLIFSVEHETLVLEFDVISDAGEKVKTGESTWEWRYSGDFDEGCFLRGVMGEFREHILAQVSQVTKEVNADSDMIIRASVSGYQD